MKRLEGKIIAVAGPRKADDFGKMVAKFGGTAVSRPAQGTVYLDETMIEAQLRALIAQPADWLLLTTGTGTEALLESAERLGLLMAFLAALGRMRIAARGYKTVAALRRYGLAPDVRDDDGTTAGLLRALEHCDLAGRRVALQLYGDPAPRMIGKLEAMGAVCEELLPYRHLPPEDSDVGLLIDDIIAGRVDAVAFTSTAQVRCVMGSAAERGMLDAVREAFAERVLAAAVGKLSAEALREEGVERALYPEEERMGSMVVAIGKFFGASGDHVA